MMRLLRTVMLGIGLIGSLFISSALGQQRARHTINDHWQFIRKDMSDGPTVQPDSTWETVNLPHTWNDEDAFDDKPGYYRGPGWYHKTLDIPADWTSKQLFLHFEGANQVADVYINGKKVTHHSGGYTAFTADITDAAQPGQANTIAVRVDNSYKENIPPLSADFTFFGGIYRDVWLVAANPVHLGLGEYGASGIRIRTPDVSEESALVTINGDIRNDSGKPATIQIKQTIYDPNGRAVDSFNSSLDIGAQQRKTFEQQSSAIDHPHLWSPSSPALYTVETTVLKDGQIVDQLRQPLGFRWYRFDPDKGFFLNGKHLDLRGTNRHQDYPGIGNALSDKIHTRDMEQIKAMGANFVRLAHYPQDPAVLEAADRLGIIIWEEIPIVNYITPSETFRDNAKQMLSEMIYQHYNHPAIMLWGYMNEILLRDKKDQYKGDSYQHDVRALADTLDQWAHRLDPERKTTMAMHQSDVYNTTGIADIPDVVGWNLYYGWYYDDFKDFGGFLDEQHKQHPDRPMIISEYGAGSDERIHTRQPQRFDFSVEYQQLYHESYLDQIDARPYLTASTSWVFNDFASESRGDSRPNINQKGINNCDRTHKDLYYFYKARFSDEPVLHIVADDYTNRYVMASDSATIPIKVYSNRPEVELFVGNDSQGKKEPGADDIAGWSIQAKAGYHQLTARARAGGELILDNLYLNAHLIPTDLKANDFTELAVDVGGHITYTPEYGSVWVPDRAYESGSWGAVGGEQKGTHHNILNSDDEPLYQSYREGLSAYRFDVPNGDYIVNLYFAEPEFSEAGKRVFSVSINGNTVLDHLDLAKEYGQWWPVSPSITVHVEGDKGIAVQFQSIIGAPILNGIRLQNAM